MRLVSVKNCILLTIYVAQLNARVICMIEEAVLSEGVEEIFQLTDGEQADTSDIFSD